MNNPSVQRDLFTEQEIQGLAQAATQSAMRSCQPFFDDDDSLEDKIKPIILDNINLVCMTMLKRHIEEINKIQEMYLQHTKEVNDKTIATLHQIIEKNLK